MNSMSPRAKTLFVLAAFSLTSACAITLTACTSRTTEAASAPPAAAAAVVRAAQTFPDARSDYPMSALPSGKVLVAGGKVSGVQTAGVSSRRSS